MYRRKYTRPVHVPTETAIDEPKKNKNRQAPAMTMTVPELAEELHISEKTAYKLVREPDFPSFNIGKRILINREGLQQWINDHADRPLTDPPKDAA